MSELLNLTAPSEDSQIPEEWLDRGEDLHERGIINRAEVTLGSLDPAAIRVGHVLTSEGQSVVAASRLRFVRADVEIREAA